VEVFKNRFQKMSSKLDPQFLEDMKEHGLLVPDNKLTPTGIRALRAILRLPAKSQLEF
jgi:hypothetical protein